MKFLALTTLVCSLMLPHAAAHADSPDTKTGFVPLFDGKSLDGWKVSTENPGSWKVEDGMLMCDGERAHLFYDGSLAPFDDFHFIAEVMTTPGSNAGIYFHTQYQESGWPKHGYECQVNLTHKDPKKTSSLYGVENIDAAAIEAAGLKDNQWYTQEIIVRGQNVVLKVNGKTMVEYTEPEGQKAFSGDFERRLGKGTFALQAHDPKSVAYFRNLRVKKLDE